jgi:hypothetical protein
MRKLLSFLLPALLLAGCGGAMDGTLRTGLQARVSQLRTAVDGHHEASARRALKEVQTDVKRALVTHQIDPDRAAQVLGLTKVISRRIGHARPKTPHKGDKRPGGTITTIPSPGGDQGSGGGEGNGGNEGGD